MNAKTTHHATYIRRLAEDISSYGIDSRFSQRCNKLVYNFQKLNYHKALPSESDTRAALEAVDCSADAIAAAIQCRQWAVDDAQWADQRVVELASTIKATMKIKNG